MVKPPIVQIAGMLRGIGRYVDTDAWAWESSLVGQMPFYPPNVAGWDATRWLNTDTWSARFNLTSADDRGRRASLDPGKAKVKADPRQLTREAIAFWGKPTLSPATVDALHAYARSAAVDAATRILGARAVPGARASTRCARSSSRAPTTTRAEMSPRPLDSRLRLPRLHPLRAAAPRRRPGRRGPAGDRAGHADAGRHRPLAARLPARLGRPRCCRSTAPAGCSTRRPSRRASRSAAAVQPTSPVLVSVYLQGGIDSMSVLYPAGDPLYPQYRTGARARRRAPGTAVHRGPAALLAPARRAARPAARRGQGQRDADGRLHRPQPVALHEPPLLGGRCDPGRPDDGLDGPLPRPRREPPTTRSRGSASTTRCRPALATARAAGRHDRPALQLLVLGAGRLGAAAGPDVRRLRRARPGRRALGRPRHGPVRDRRR